MNHHCIKTFPTYKIDDCSGEGSNECKGVNPMILSLYCQSQDGQESYYDDSIELEVNFCPFCGLKAENDIKV